MTQSPTHSRNSGKKFNDRDRREAAILLSTAVDFMARKAGVTPQEIVAAIDADRQGHAMRYLASLLASGIVA